MSRENPTMSDLTNTVRLPRVLCATPERVYRAFLDPDALAKWLPPHGFTGKVHQMDARPGGGYRMSFTNVGTGRSHSFGGRYIELTPHETIRYTDQFDDPSMPVAFCYLGWQESLSLLAHVVEPEIPDGAKPCAGVSHAHVRSGGRTIWA
jgi:uncharacterized protein YndB with AHSA1/START domain